VQLGHFAVVGNRRAVFHSAHNQRDVHPRVIVLSWQRHMSEISGHGLRQYLPTIIVYQGADETI
jgi:hypothetical protein